MPRYRNSLPQLSGNLFLADAGVEPTARAESLPIEAFCALARAYRRQARA